METLQIFLAIAILLIVLLSIYIYRQKNCITRFAQANEKFSNVEIKLGREVYGLKQDVKAVEENYENEKERSSYLLKQCKDVNEIKNDMFQNNKKLEIKYRTIRTKLKNANHDLIEYNDDHFRNKRK